MNTFFWFVLQYFVEWNELNILALILLARTVCNFNIQPFLNNGKNDFTWFNPVEGHLLPVYWLLWDNLFLLFSIWINWIFYFIFCFMLCCNHPINIFKCFIFNFYWAWTHHTKFYLYILIFSLLCWVKILIIYVYIGYILLYLYPKLYLRVAIFSVLRSHQKITAL